MLQKKEGTLPEPLGLVLSEGLVWGCVPGRENSRETRRLGGLPPSARARHQKELVWLGETWSS